MKYLVFNSKKEASQEAYKIIKSLIDENSTLGLATGSTPTDLYEEMIQPTRHAARGRASDYPITLTGAA